MIAAFTAGVRVKMVKRGDGYKFRSTLSYASVISHGARDNETFTISDYKKSFGWLMPGYLGEGFYQIRRQDGREFIAHEDDLILAESDHV